MANVTGHETNLVRDPTKPLEDDKSLGELMSRLTTDFGKLVSTQVELAKVELKEEIGQAAKGAGMVTGAAVAGILALLLLSMAAAWGLAEVMPEGWAFAIVGVVWAIVGAVLFVNGRKKISSVAPIAPTTQETLKEDVEWARQQKA